MRLDKFLADMGVGTRSEIKKEIKAGRVAVDGTQIKDPGFKVPSDAAVTYCGMPVAYEEFEYFMLNKPAGVISASEDSREETVIDLIDEQKRKDLFPVGRLDRDTEGLLLITNDGELAHRLLSPKHHVDKTYYAKLAEIADASDVTLFREGLILTDGLECLPAELEILDPPDEVLITIREGKFHQIKRMFQSVGNEVIYLKRLSMGPLELDPDLPCGQYRRLTGEEIASLKDI